MIPRSCVSHIAWPAVPDRPGALLLAMQHQLAQSQWLPPEELERLQLEALGRLGRHAAQTVPYYRGLPTYAVLGVGAPPSADDWRQLPVLGRPDVQAAGPALRSESVPPDHQPLGEVITTGSTGRPVRGVTTAVTALFWRAITLRELLWHGRDLTAKLAAVRADLSDQLPPSGLVLDGWGPATDPVYDTGPCVVLSIRHDVESQARWLMEQDPDYLLSYPSNLLALAQHFQDTGATLPKLREVSSYGETLTPQARAACHDAWGVRVVDMYSTQELGYIALQCPESERYHVQSENLYVEVLDGRGQPCAPGDIGRVVVSTLHNYAMPLLRYELGDYAEVGGPCPCGRGLSVLTRIVGRERNMWSLPTGRRVWPLFSSRVWGRIEVIRQLQLVQHEIDHIEARIVGPRPLTAQEEFQLTAMLRQQFTYPFHLSFTYLDSIDRSQGLKFEDFVSRVGTRATAATPR